MNYRHAFHAGNFADVAKHLALVAVLLHLHRKEKPFCVIDTHAGRGLYDLGSSEATRSHEAENGIARLRDLVGRPDLPDALRTYLQCVEQDAPDGYPGSPLLAARLLRSRDRLIAIEKHEEEARHLRQALAPYPQARVIEADGYARLSALLPPGERRGAVLIDPPYEETDEGPRVADLLARAYHRFSTGIYLLWFPTKSDADAQALTGELRTLGISPAVRLDIDLGGPSIEPAGRLSSAGLVVVNPPYTFESEIMEAAKFLAPRLGRTEHVPAALALTGI